MKRISTVMTMLFCSHLLLAQSAVMLQHAGASTPYYGTNGFNDAYNAAVNGDTILLPGGFFGLNTVIDKRIAVIGVGHHPDSTLATLPTVITGNISLGENADSCLLMGMRIQGGVYPNSGGKTNFFTLSRLYVEGQVYGYGDATNYSQNGTIRECVIMAELVGVGLEKCTVVNNILVYRLSNFRNSMIANNLFLGGPGYHPITSNSDCVIRNNIFYNAVPDWSQVTNCQIQRNIFSNDPQPYTNSLQNNYANVNTGSLFVSYSGSGYSYSNNFHLNTPASYPGTDATQVGLYGTTMPWKEGSVPINPHIQTKSIADQTNTNGTLPVQVKVAAQNQ